MGCRDKRSGLQLIVDVRSRGWMGENEEGGGGGRDGDGMGRNDPEGRKGMSDFIWVVCARMRNVSPIRTVIIHAPCSCSSNRGGG